MTGALRRRSPVVALLALAACGPASRMSDAPPSPPPVAAGCGGGVPAGTCLGSDLLASLGRSRILLGLSGSDQAASAAPYDLRYQYVAGGIADGSGPCASCASGCAAGGASCANSNPLGCGWWGCWQYDQLPPGQFVRDFLAQARGRGQIPMITYYMLLQASGAAEQPGLLMGAAANQAFMARYLADYRFLLQQLGSATAIVHVEPDFWGYAEQVSEDPTRIPASVAGANPADCGDLPDTIAGLGRCFVAMARTLAPGARVALHASGWGRISAGLLNADRSVDIALEGRLVGTFLREVGADGGDLVVADMSDRDADWYLLGAPPQLRRNVWWDASDQRLPDFAQALAWGKAVAETVGKPILWWQIPVGNTGLRNRYTSYDRSGNPIAGEWRDNRVEVLLAHPGAVAAAHGIGLAFGAGMAGQTTPDTDGGLLHRLVSGCVAQGGEALCR